MGSYTYNLTITVIILQSVIQVKFRGWHLPRGNGNEMSPPEILNFILSMAIKYSFSHGTPKSLPKSHRILFRRKVSEFNPGVRWVVCNHLLNFMYYVIFMQKCSINRLNQRFSKSKDYF